MARHAHEFQCDGRGTYGPGKENCGWFNYPMLDDKMHGNYIIICGHCGHEHYRVIKNGVVTDDRHSKSLGDAGRIHVMPAACSPTRRQLGAVAQFRALETAGLATDPDRSK